MSSPDQLSEARRFVANLLRYETPEDALAIQDMLEEGWEKDSNAAFSRAADKVYGMQRCERCCVRGDLLVFEDGVQLPDGSIDIIGPEQRYLCQKCFDQGGPL